MAKSTKRNSHAPLTGEAKALAEVGEEHTSRLADARQQKAHSQEDIQEAYYFCAPRRVRSSSSNSSSANRSTDANELQTSLGFEVSEDFMTMVIESFMPQAGRWAERLPDASLDKGIKDRLQKMAREEDEKIFLIIRASRFYAELAKQGVPDGSIGVFAMHIYPDRGLKPPVCIGIPIRKLEMNLGPDGRIDDRFVVEQTKYRHVKALLPGVTLPSEVTRKIKEEADGKVAIEWGYWRKWDRDDDEVWKHCLKVGETTITSAELSGAGCCPLVVGRFGATPDYAWPDGATIKALPDFRQLDEMRAAFIENIDFTLRPPTAYDDDGVLGGHLENGIEPGKLYPRRPGGNNRQTFEKIYEPNPLEAALFDADKLERRIKRLHYVDFPEQPGKTPPTLGQWLDEMVEAQKKIGTPGYSFWSEFPYEAFRRFCYLGEKSGKIKKVEVPGTPAVSLQAYNPAQRAQENQEVLTATRLMQIGASAFPQTWQVAVDELPTLTGIQDKLGDKIVKFRTPDSLGAAADTLAKLGGVFGPKLAGGLTGGGNVG